MPFHIRVTPLHGDRTDELVAVDLEEDFLRQRVVDPYLRGVPFTVRGRTFDPFELRRIKIGYTDEPASYHVTRIRDARPAGFITTTPDSYYVPDRGQDRTDDFIVGPPGSANPEPRVDEPGQREAAEVPEADARSVMVVYGRDGERKRAIFAFLRALDLRPIEWEVAVAATDTATPFTLDVIRAGFGLARAVLVLLTPDDLAHLKPEFLKEDDQPFERELTGQARPNVLIEAGMALATHPARTVIVEVGHLRPMSDLAGLNTVRLDGSPESRSKLANRLRAAGAAVETVGEDWLSAGEFRSPEPPGEVPSEPAASSDASASGLRDFIQTWKQIDQPFTLDLIVEALGIDPADARTIIDRHVDAGEMVEAG